MQHTVYVDHTSRPMMARLPTQKYRPMALALARSIFSMYWSLSWVVGSERQGWGERGGGGGGGGDLEGQTPRLPKNRK